MRHALAPTREGSVGKGVITEDWVTVMEGVIDPVVSQSLNRRWEKVLRKKTDGSSDD
jgi:hypothetical protein